MFFLSRSAILLTAVTLSLSACSDGSPTISPGSPPSRYTEPAEPANGEFVRASNSATVYLVYNRTLYGVPDMQTLRACTGGYEKVVRVVNALPSGWGIQSLPSAGNPQARPHGRAWMHGDAPVKDSRGTISLLVGCVRSGIPTQQVFQNTFGDLNFGRAVLVSDSDLARFPEGPVANGNPLRRAGTLINNGWVKWVTYHTGSLGVEDGAAMDSYCRPWTDLVTVSSGEHQAYSQPGILKPASPGCLRGDDYPYKYHSTSGADAAWNYFYRQCTSFVAWRLNQEGIEFHNYYRGRHFGDAYMWADTARAAGLTVNSTPRRGAVAHWSSGHVAYVAAVENNTGYITIEEYNYSPYAYTTRRIPASGVSNFIHFR